MHQILLGATLGKQLVLGSSLVSLVSVQAQREQFGAAMKNHQNPHCHHQILEAKPTERYSRLRLLARARW